jgi:glycosyltransferase involved in cell wall biosynthesis
MANDHQSLTVVIPALNEEETIGDTIARCLAEAANIKQEAGLTEVEVIVVSDGSTDSTAKIARGYGQVKVIEFEHNRGYGAAIKEGWRQGNGTLVGFLDADGTCDPKYFGPMCRIALEDSADVVLGSRLGPDSKMPKIRRIGNRLYAFLLGLLCGRGVTDTASGMRVIRRRSLGYLGPLPDGLHFTPSMSARALLNDLRVVEIPMTYDERGGTSKLSVMRDGIRFLQTILEGVLLYRPEKILFFGASLCILIIVVLGAYPVEFYLRNGRFEEWMVYRFVVCQLLASLAVTFVLAAGLANELSHFGPRRSAATAFWPSLITSFLDSSLLPAVTVLLLALSAFFLWPGVVEYWTTGHVTLHWSRLIAGTFALLSAAQTATFGFLAGFVSLWIRQDGDHTRHESPGAKQPQPETDPLAQAK